MADDNTLDKAIDLFYAAAVGPKPSPDGEDLLTVDEIAKGINAALDDLAAAGRLLPPGGEVVEHWAYRCSYDDKGHWTSRESVEEMSRHSGIPPLRREVRTWPDGTQLIGPWSPVVSDDKEATDAP